MNLNKRIQGDLSDFRRIRNKSNKTRRLDSKFALDHGVFFLHEFYAKLLVENNKKPLKTYKPAILLFLVLLLYL